MFVTRNTRPERGSSTVESRVNALLTGQAQYSLHEAAERAGVDIAFARRFWLAMGFPSIDDEINDIVFTSYDVEIMRRHADKVRVGKLNTDALSSLVRAQSHMADRLVLWQYEALVEFARATFELDDVAARYWVLDHIDEYLPFLEEQLKYAWRRHMAGFLRRSEIEIDRRGVDDQNEEMPLMRALGFVDLVAFTMRSRQLGSRQLVNFIRDFEFTCRDVVARNGARVVKTVGDAVLYIADDLATGARVVTDLVSELGKIEGMLPVRGSLVWGGVVSSFGDVFGSNVNLASRLVDVAPQGTVLVDRDTATAMLRGNLTNYTVVPFGEQELAGMGSIEAFEIRKIRR